MFGQWLYPGDRLKMLMARDVGDFFKVKIGHQRLVIYQPLELVTNTKLSPTPASNIDVTRETDVCVEVVTEIDHLE